MCWQFTNAFDETQIAHNTPIVLSAEIQKNKILAYNFAAYVTCWLKYTNICQFLKKVILHFYL